MVCNFCIDRFELDDIRDHFCNPMQAVITDWVEENWDEDELLPVPTIEGLDIDVDDETMRQIDNAVEWRYEYDEEGRMELTKDLAYMAELIGEYSVNKV